MSHLKNVEARILQCKDDVNIFVFVSGCERSIVFRRRHKWVFLKDLLIRY